MPEKRVVCLNCMDGRVQLPVIFWIKEHYKADNVDVITRAGIDGYLADEKIPVEGIIASINISIEKNDASMIFVVGHYDCRGNPVSDPEHKDHIAEAVGRIKKGFPALPVKGLWVNERFEVEEV